MDIGLVVEAFHTHAASKCPATVTDPQESLGKPCSFGFRSTIYNPKVCSQRTTMGDTPPKLKRLKKYNNNNALDVWGPTY